MKQLVYVYISEVTDRNAVLPSFIDENRITNKKALAEKRTAYSLLCKAAKEVFDIDMDIQRLTKTENGKPIYPGFCFSLSHSRGACAVAVSKENVGIDIEEEICGERAERIRKKILHKNESPDSDTTELWTKKEAVFKLRGDKIFVGCEIDTTAYHTESKILFLNNKKYTVTAATNNSTEIIWK